MNRDRVVKLRDELRSEHIIAKTARQSSTGSINHASHEAAEIAYKFAVQKLDALLEICDVCDSRGWIVDEWAAGAIPGEPAQQACPLCSGSGKQPAESETDETR